MTVTEAVAEKLWDYFHDLYDTDEYTNQYILDVLLFANEQGYVSSWVSRRLFHDHGSSEQEYLEDNNPKDNALFILEYLGY